MKPSEIIRMKAESQPLHRSSLATMHSDLIDAILEYLDEQANPTKESKEGV